MKTKATTWLAQIAVVLVMLAAGSASASSGLLSANSCRGKNTLEGGFHRASASVSVEGRRGWGDFCHEGAAGSVVAPAKLVNCFPPDTLVGTESGLRPMSQIGAGERVWGYDFLNGVWRLCRVECRHDANYDGPLVTLYADVGKVTATAYHPFWVIQGDDLASRPTPRHVGEDEDQGGSLPGRWVNSHDLREGDVVFLRGRGPMTVRRVVQRHEQTPVCNLTVEELHTFAVGEMQVLVHNASGTGGQPPLRSIHPDSSLSKSSLDFWGKKSTPEIIDSLRPGQAEALRAYPDGRIANGNTRVKILRERGVDVDALPREIHNP